MPASRHATGGMTRRWWRFCAHFSGYRYVASRTIAWLIQWMLPAGRHIFMEATYRVKCARTHLTWEIRPSGIIGGPRETSVRVEMRSHLATERAGMVTLHLQPARPSSIPTLADDDGKRRTAGEVADIRQVELEGEGSQAPGAPGKDFLGPSRRDGGNASRREGRRRIARRSPIALQFSLDFSSPLR